MDLNMENLVSFGFEPVFVFTLHQVDVLLGDPSKARSILGWDPTKTPFVEVGYVCYCLRSNYLTDLFVLTKEC